MFGWVKGSEVRKTAKTSNSNFSAKVKQNCGRNGRNSSKGSVNGIKDYFTQLNTNKSGRVIADHSEVMIGSEINWITGSQEQPLKAE